MNSEFATNDRNSALDPALSQALSRIRIVLIGTSHAGNVGSTARAMKTMGLSQLWLVAPKISNITGRQDAISLSSGALDVLENARQVDNLTQALSGCAWAVASSGRLRELSPPIANARDCARMAHDRLAQHTDDIAFVFGAERTGLLKEDIALCNALCIIDGNPRYMSLNLSQAVQIVAYELRMAGLDSLQASSENAENLNTETEHSSTFPDQNATKSTPKAKLPPSFGGMADAASVSGMLTHLEQALVAVNFLDPDNPKRLMPRLQRLFSRLELEREEIDILRGMARAMIDAAQKAAQKAK